MHLPDYLRNDFTKEVSIRLAQPEDVSKVLKIILEAYAPIEPILGRKPRGLLETPEKLLERIDEKTLYTVLRQNEILGTFTIKKSQRYGLMEVQKVAVKKEYQNKGLGSFIMDSAEHLLREQGERIAAVETYEDHQQLVDFYLHRGYKIKSERMSKGNVVLLMTKKLWRED